LSNYGFLCANLLIKIKTGFLITVNTDSFTINRIQEIEEVDTDEHYQPKISIGIIDVDLRQMMWRLSVWTNSATTPHILLMITCFGTLVFHRDDEPQGFYLHLVNYELWHVSIAFSTFLSYCLVFWCGEYRKVSCGFGDISFWYIFFLHYSSFVTQRGGTKW